MNTKKLILGFYVGCIALSAASFSMSVAWFASSTRVFVNSIQIEIDCDRELFISTDKDGEYVERIDFKELDPNGKFVPLTNAYSSRWRDNKSKAPVFYDETKYSIDEHADLVTPVDFGYFSQKFYLLGDDDLWITIDAEKSFLKANEEYNKTYAAKLYKQYQNGDDEQMKKLTKEEIEVRLNKLINAMRYSILVTDEKDYDYVIIDPNKNDDTVYGGLLDNDIDKYYDYFTRESDGLDYERVYGELVGDKSKIVYDKASKEDSGYLDVDEEPSAFNARHKKDVKRFNLEKSKLNGVDFKKENAIDLNDFNNKVKPFHFPIYRDKPQEIVVSIFLEGWDLDSVNYTMGATFISELAFKIEREM